MICNFPIKNKVFRKKKKKKASSFVWPCKEDYSPHLPTMTGSEKTVKNTEANSFYTDTQKKEVVSDVKEPAIVSNAKLSIVHSFLEIRKHSI